MYAVVNDLVQETIGIMKYDIYGHFFSQFGNPKPVCQSRNSGIGGTLNPRDFAIEKTAGFPGSRISRDSGSRDCNTTVIILQAS